MCAVSSIWLAGKNIVSQKYAILNYIVLKDLSYLKELSIDPCLLSISQSACREVPGIQRHYTTDSWKVARQVSPVNILAK